MIGGRWGCWRPRVAGKWMGLTKKETRKFKFTRNIQNFNFQSKTSVSSLSYLSPKDFLKFLDEHLSENHQQTQLIADFLKDHPKITESLIPYLEGHHHALRHKGIVAEGLIPIKKSIRILNLFHTMPETETLNQILENCSNQDSLDLFFFLRNYAFCPNRETFEIVFMKIKEMKDPFMAGMVFKILLEMEHIEISDFIFCEALEVYAVLGYPDTRLPGVFEAYQKHGKRPTALLTQGLCSFYAARNDSETIVSILNESTLRGVTPPAICYSKLYNVYAKTDPEKFLQSIKESTHQLPIYPSSFLVALKYFQQHSPQKVSELATEILKSGYSLTEEISNTIIETLISIGEYTEAEIWTNITNNSNIEYQKNIHTGLSKKYTYKDGEWIKNNSDELEEIIEDIFLRNKLSQKLGDFRSTSFDMKDKAEE